MIARLGLVCLLVASLVSCTSSRIARPTISPEGYVVPQTTILKLRMETPLGSRVSQAGDSIVATLVEPLEANGETILPQGLTVEGRITEVHRARHKGVGGTIILSFDSIQLSNGSRIPIRGTLREIIRSQRAKDVEVGLASNLVGRGPSGLLKVVLVVGATTGGAFVGIGPAVGAGLITYLGSKYAFVGHEAVLEKGAIITVRLDRPITLSRTRTSTATENHTTFTAE